MNLVSSVIGALFFDGAVFNIITVTSLHRAPLSPAGCEFFNCGKAGMRLLNATFLKTRTLGGLLAPDKKNLQYDSGVQFGGKPLFTTLRGETVIQYDKYSCFAAFSRRPL